MKFNQTETRLITFIIHLLGELDRACDLDPADRNTPDSIAVALGIPALGPIVNPLLDSGAEPGAVETAVLESGYTLFDLEQYTELGVFVSERHLAISDSLSQLLLDQQRGPESGELIHFPHHRTIQ